MPDLATRPGASRPPVRAVAAAVHPEDAVQARRVSCAWRRPALSWAAGGLIAWGGLPLMGLDQWADVALAGGAAAAVGTGLAGQQHRSRQQLLANLGAALAARTGPCQVRARRWGRGWVGAPLRVRLDYLAEMDDTGPAWLADLARITGRRLGATYTVACHDPRRCRVTLRKIPARPAAEALPEATARAERIVHELLGPAAAITPHWGDDETLVAVDVEHESGVRVATAAQRARVERVVSTMLPGRWRARWDLEKDTVRLELRPELPRSLPNPAEPITSANRLHLPYGVDEDGRQLVWNLAPDAVEPHHLVCGTTGSGKTSELNGIILAAAARGFATYLIDPKRIEFMGLRNYPNVVMVATVVEEMVAVIHRLYELMEDRYRALEAGEAVESDFDPVVIVIDEFRNLARMVGAWYAGIKVRGMPAKCPVFEEVAAIAEKGRSAHVHLAIGLQRPDVALVFADGMRDNFRSRVSMGRLSPQGALMMWDAAHVGVAIPRGLPGRGVAIGDHDAPVEIQTYWTPDPRRTTPDRVEDHAILRRLRPTGAAHEPLVLVPPSAPDADDPQLTYYDWITAEFVPSSTRPDLAPGSVTSSPTSFAHAGAVRAARVGENETGAGDLAAEVDDISADTTDDAGDDNGGYGPLVDVPVSRLAAGDLVLVDESRSLWAVLEACEEDLVEEGYVCLDWRSDQDETGSISLADSEIISARHPLDELVAA